MPCFAAQAIPWITKRFVLEAVWIEADRTAIRDE